MVIFLWQFYAPISSFFNINFEGAPALWVATSSVIAMTLVVGICFTIMFHSNVPEMLARRNFAVVIPTVEFNKNFSPEGEIVIPYSLENKRSDVITEIGVSIFAPGLLVLSEKRNILYKSIGGKSTENGELELLYIPKEAVPGEYTVELNWSFYVGSKKYTKTNEIKVNVVS